jgi:hypothetical protein
LFDKRPFLSDAEGPVVSPIEPGVELMPRRWPTLLGWSAILGLLLVHAVLSPSGAGQQPADKSFSPVAPAMSLHAALEYNLKIARDWLDQKDYASAAQTAQGIILLIQLYGYQSDQASWRDKIAALRDACSTLGDVARDKDKAACDKAAAACDRLLAELGKNPPTGDKVVAKDFKSFGSTRQWMVLMDGTYGDAKAARNTRDLANWAYTLAEQANLAVHLRADQRWRDAAREMREAALATAKKAQDNDLAVARGELKKVYQSCEACHQGYRKP